MRRDNLVQKPALEPSNSEYLDLIIQGTIAHKLPQHYIDTSKWRRFRPHTQFTVPEEVPFWVNLWIALRINKWQMRFAVNQFGFTEFMGFYVNRKRLRLCVKNQ